MDTSLINKGLLIPAVVVVVILLGISVWGLMPPRSEVSQVHSFTECAAAGNPIMESYPRQCRSADGQLFVEDVIPPVDDLSSFIVVDTPLANTLVTSPLVVNGKARGTWYFEASFPVRLLDANGKELIVLPAQAQGEWMTEEFVPFEVELTFQKPETETGILVLEKDNPSGLPQYDKKLEIPVRFSAGSAKACIVTGCSGQICSDEEVITTCEMKPEYACYKNAKCERQASGTCGWTQTTELKSCLAGKATSVPELE